MHLNLPLLLEMGGKTDLKQSLTNSVPEEINAGRTSSPEAPLGRWDPSPARGRGYICLVSKASGTDPGDDVCLVT